MRDPLKGWTRKDAALADTFSIPLHYVFDLWADWWRCHRANGDVIIVRFADDYTVGFQHEEDARQFLAKLHERLAKFGLALHPDKTRLIEFG